MKQEYNIKSDHELNKSIDKAKVELLGLLIIIIPIVFFICLELKNKNNTKKIGIETKAVIISYNSRIKGASSYNYIFCLNDFPYNGTLTVRVDEHGWFVYGDVITILYNPNNPKKNYPAIMLYKKDVTKLEKYKNEIPINFKNIPELYKFRHRGLIERYNWVDIREKYPISKEAFPCLPQEYYGEF
jgi:hypothetical protein